MEHDLLLIDTGAFYAFYDKKDSKHEEIAGKLRSRMEPFVTTNYIVDELITVLRARNIHVDKCAPFIDSILKQEICSILRISEDMELKAWEFMKKYKEHKFSFTDCTSFVTMQNYGIKKACTLDNHFWIAGFEII